MSVEKRRDGESAQRVCGERALGHKDGDSQTGEEYETVRGSSQSLCICTIHCVLDESVSHPKGAASPPRNA